MIVLRNRKLQLFQKMLMKTMIVKKRVAFFKAKKRLIRFFTIYIRELIFLRVLLLFNIY